MWRTALWVCQIFLSSLNKKKYCLWWLTIIEQCCKSNQLNVHTTTDLHTDLQFCLHFSRLLKYVAPTAYKIKNTYTHSLYAIYIQYTVCINISECCILTKVHETNNHFVGEQRGGARSRKYEKSFIKGGAMWKKYWSSVCKRMAQGLSATVTATADAGGLTTIPLPRLPHPTMAFAGLWLAHHLNLQMNFFALLVALAQVQYCSYMTDWFCVCVCVCWGEGI